MSHDHSMDDGDSSSESNGQQNSAELSKTALALRNQLATLPANNALEFLANVRKHCPELIPQLQALSRKQVQLKRLKWVNHGRDLLSSCRTLMKDTRCDWPKLTENFRNACLHAQEHVEITYVGLSEVFVRTVNIEDQDTFKAGEDMDPDGYASNILSLFCEQTVLSRWIERRFLDLQLLLTDDFRKRLAQIARQSESPWSEPFPNVMNAIWYLRHVVEEWSDSCLLSGITSTGGRAVFDESSAMFKHVWNQMAEDVITSLRVQTIDVIKPYQQHFWCAMEPRLGNTTQDITDIFCPVLMKVRTTFANTGAQISKASLEELFKRMSSALATVILEEIVDVTPFRSIQSRAEGATQMLFDMENGLIPILSHIFSRCGVAPNMYYDEIFVFKAFIILLGSLKLLSLSWAVITLLKDEIDQLPEEVADEKLFEMKIYGVNKERARNLIRLRSDIDKGMDELR
ncbi:hypothetical protein ANCCEY_11099 [Ancylostoma ceylanicum]|uniref:Uncharacterized protein n=1 Tax=Ancylostoma ceylanicum TaxID=53326 RepID=A0A0D6LD71_9BILA|nr:hypothetical protein ANCCEY_11099 [Ancylostoma ceylanicum]